MSAEYCGCDPEAKHLCDRHRIAALLKQIDGLEARVLHLQEQLQSCRR